MKRSGPNSVLDPILVSRSEHEKCLIEPSINSVRISIAIKKSDELEVLLCKKYSSFLMKRAEMFYILRRKPIPVYIHNGFTFQ